MQTGAAADGFACPLGHQQFGLAHQAICSNEPSLFMKWQRPMRPTRLMRLWQPSRPAFWLMLAFNALSSVCSYAMRALPLNTAGMLLVGSVALINVAAGLWAAWQLVKEPSVADGQRVSPEP
jgi:hypothetical protein